MKYREDEFLLLSGIQHFSFCRRQWALIYIEQQWSENLKTIEGQIVHEQCHDEDFWEKRGDLLVVRGLRVFSADLGVSGQCDVVEFNAAPTGCILKGRSGCWRPYPIEYKRGKSKSIDADRLQLCVQAMCLEQMLCVDIPKGALYYNETHRREEVDLSDEMRDAAKTMLNEMHDYYRRGATPKVKPKRGCSSCSLKEICLPEICKDKSLSHYFSSFLDEAS